MAYNRIFKKVTNIPTPFFTGTGQHIFKFQHQTFNAHHLPASSSSSLRLEKNN